jgi:hypothetical protein
MKVWQDTAPSEGTREQYLPGLLAASGALPSALPCHVCLTLQWKFFIHGYQSCWRGTQSTPVPPHFNCSYFKWSDFQIRSHLETMRAGISIGEFWGNTVQLVASGLLSLVTSKNNGVAWRCCSIVQHLFRTCEAVGPIPAMARTLHRSECVTYKAPLSAIEGQSNT